MRTGLWDGAACSRLTSLASFLSWTGGRLGMGSRSPSSAMVVMVLRDSFLGLAGTP